MGTLRLALAQMNPTVGDLEGNCVRVAEAVERARDLGADLLAAPELAITGYPPEDLVLRPAFVRDNLTALGRLASSVGGIAAVVGFVDRDASGIYNAAALLAGGEVKDVYHKHLLPNYGVFDEKRYFLPGEGILLARVRGVLLGVTVCEDVWEPGGPHAACAAAGATVVVNINGSPYHRGKGGERLALLAERARSSGAAFAYVNMVGGQDELVFDGQSLVVDAAGNLVARAAQFEEELLVADLELPPPSGGPRRAGAGEALRVVDLGEVGRGPRSPLPERVAEPIAPAGEVYAALVLGVRDYLRKNGFAGALLGLSGGIDSSLAAAVAADAIGPAGVLGALLPSEFTSRDSVELARALAANLGIETVTLPIADAFEAMLKTLDPVFSGTAPGLAEENAQARIRGTSLMAISNKTGRIVLSTGNKSEMATGYATLYGDMAGGFAVLKDVPKTLVYELARWRNRESEVIPQGVIDRPPTAELRPGQLDTDSLPPYEVLDPILAAYVEEDRSVEEIVAAGADPATVRRVVEMVDRAEYKRRQAAPGIKITVRAFGRDRRPPITNRYRPPGP